MLDIRSEHPPQRWQFIQQLVTLTWPIAVSMLSYSLMTAIDTLFVGRKGASAIAAVGLGGLVSFTLLTFAMGLLRAGKVLTAHAYGAKQQQRIDGIAQSTCWLSILLSAVVGAATLLVTPVLHGAFDEPEPGRLVAVYVSVRAAAIPFFLAATAIRECSQALGDTRRPMNAAVVANLANIPLNALFVVVLDWGVVGSALANVIAQIVDFACLARQRRTWLPTYWPDWLAVKNVAKLGWPLGIEMFLDVSSFATLAFIIARFGAIELAAHQIALQVSQLTILPLLALSESASVLAGQSAGARRLCDVRPIVRASLAVGLGYATTLALSLVTCHNAIAAVFTNDAEVSRLASLLIQVLAGFQLSFVFYAVGRAVLRGLGDLRFTACVTVGVAWICTPTLGWLLGHTFGYGVMGGWCGVSLEVTLASVLYFVRLERNGWSRAAQRVRLESGTDRAALDSDQVFSTSC